MFDTPTGIFYSFILNFKQKTFKKNIPNWHQNAEIMMQIFGLRLIPFKIDNNLRLFELLKGIKMGAKIKIRNQHFDVSWVYSHQNCDGHFFSLYSLPFILRK
ncbi:MAG: hypothetical protein HEEMFOPI_01485 [Holosporales bacterium]